MTLKEQRIEDIRQTGRRIKKRIKPTAFQEYAAFYYFSNEQINRKYSEIDFTNYHTALTVLSSGDHAFNAIYHGIDIVDTFDINRLTEYYALGFKKRAIECLSFEQFCLLYNLKGPKLMELEDEIMKNMDEDYRVFWKNFKYKMKWCGNFFPSVISWARENNTPKGGRYNAYLENEETYKQLQKRFDAAKITFTQANITELPVKFRRYDLVELSNILSYSDEIFKSCVEERREKLYREIYDKNLNVNGVITEAYSIYKKEPGHELRRTKK